MNTNLVHRSWKARLIREPPIVSTVNQETDNSRLTSTMETDGNHGKQLWTKHLLRARVHR